MTRIERLRKRLEEPLLVTNPVNVRYLTGLQSSNAALLVAQDRLTVFADFRYATAARVLEGVDFVETPQALLKGIAERLEGRISFEEEDVTVVGYNTLRAGGLELVPRSGLIEELRAVKDEVELDAIRGAAAITDEVYAAMAEERFVGRNERELAWRMEQFFHERGADGIAFELIVGSGPTGSLPHGRPTDRVVESRELVVIDAGCVVDGYCSDCTRTFVTGVLPEELTRAYSVCLEAQLAGLAAVRDGADGVSIDRAAREVIEAAGYGKDFGHGLGHGVGLQVHEAPRLSPESDSVLAAGNVVTVEPGIYLAGQAGVRIEDLVVVTEGEPEVLSRFTKEPVSVG